LVLAFGAFRLLTGQRLLLEADKPLRLGSRALDILMALLERPGELIGKHELLARVWPDMAVVEDNLTVHVAALRRVLGDGKGPARYIVNTPGRGYRFVAPVEQQLDGSVGIAAERCLPARLTRLIGREAAIAKLLHATQAGRLTTLTGPGGVGKSVVALDAADRLDPHFEHGTRRVDLAESEDERSVCMTIAAALGLDLGTGDPVPRLLGALTDKRMLLVLDNCDPAIDLLAPLIPVLLGAAPGIHLIVTGREALRLEGEQVLRLPPLAVPPQGDGLTAAQALSFAAIALFVDRAANSSECFALTDATAPAVARLCRALDGIPLALLLAAAQIGIFGTAGLAAWLRDGPEILGPGLRNAPARHRSLRASFDASSRRLSGTETAALQHLAGFADDFRLDEAIAALHAGVPPIGAAAEIFAGLVAKSLISVDLSGPIARYRLFRTVRPFALTR
jgi:predicted ATPase/DNA-binding winged helix-turn-helix (wHTH) protein